MFSLPSLSFENVQDVGCRRLQNKKLFEKNIKNPVRIIPGFL